MLWAKNWRRTNAKQDVLRALDKHIDKNRKHAETDTFIEEDDEDEARPFDPLAS